MLTPTGRVTLPDRISVRVTLTDRVTSQVTLNGAKTLTDVTLIVRDYTAMEPQGNIGYY
jgi:hypothetical protein